MPHIPDYIKTKVERRVINYFVDDLHGCVGFKKPVLENHKVAVGAC